MTARAAADWYAATHRTWGDILAEVAARQPEREAVIFGEERITYGDLARRVDRVAAGLLRLGVKRGDHVALWMTNRPEWIYVQFAVYRIGAVLLPVYTRFKADEVAYALAQSDSSTLIFEDNFLGKIDALGMLRGICPEVEKSPPGELSAKGFPRLRRVIDLSGSHPGMYSFEELLAAGAGGEKEVVAAARAVDPMDVMNIIYTSGTTGFPKGGLSRHRNNLASIYHITERMDLRPEHRCLLNLPLFSNFGCMFVAALAFLRGATVVLQKVLDPEEAFRAIERERITHLFGSPAFFISYLDHPARSRYDLSSLVGGMVGGSPLPPSTMEAIVGELGAREMLNVYGLSECGGVATTTRREDPMERRANTVGVALPNALVKITDPHTGAELGPGQEGEICLGDARPGSCVGAGYYNMPEKTREAIDPEGWFHTGDLGVLDEAGYLRVTGRVKDMFLVGGFNVYPVEVENVLHTHPAVSQAQVVGVPDRRLGEVGMAFVELREGASVSEQELIEFAAARLANFKVPRYVRFVRGFPLTGSGKVKKFMLREQAIRELGLGEQGAAAENKR